MNGFIIHPTYEKRDGKTIVQLYGKLENGQTFRADIDQIPHFFIRKEDLQTALSVTTFTHKTSTLLTMRNEPVVEINTVYPSDVPPLRDELRNAGVPTFEADVRFAYRYLIDNNLRGSITITGESTQGNRVDRVYKNPAIQASNSLVDLSICSLDIESDHKANELWCISLVCGDRTEKLIIDREVEGAISCADEADFLRKLNGIIQDMDPDIITGWNVVDFDLNVLQDKYREHKIPFDWSRDSNRSVRLRVEQNFLRESTAEITGRMVLDGIHLLKNNFIKLDSYTLESAAQEFVGEGKLFSGDHRYEDIKRSYEQDPKTLLEYNVKDAQLVLDILDASNTLQLTIKRSQLTGMQLDRVKASIASLDNVYLPQLRKRGFVAPTKGFSGRESPITGGFVMESKAGIYDYVIVCDFKSLYPSIMRTLNVDPLSYRPNLDVESSDEFTRAENGAVFSQTPGILPSILESLLAEREKARKRGDELARFAIKILMNSFYGALASPNCRFYNRHMASAITHTGQYVTKKAAEVISQKGFEVIYGDTDSIFVDLGTDTEDEAIATGKEIERHINDFFAKHTQERYHRESKLEMEYEKTFVRFLMPMTRGGEASKKRYAGLVRKGDDLEISVTGLELVRRDWTDLAKQFQQRLLELVFAKEDPKSYVSSYVEKLRAGEFDDLLVYRKALRKKLSSYTKTTPPHVRAARLLDRVESDIIEYVWTVDGPEPVGATHHSLDYQHYIDKQLEPIADSILVFYDTSFHDVLKGTSQKGLFEF